MKKKFNIYFIQILAVILVLTGCGNAVDPKPIPLSPAASTSPVPVARKVQSARVPVFMFHAVTENVFDARYPDNFFRPQMLQKNLEFLQQNRCETVFVRDLAQIGLFQRPVALTFDDGLKNFYTIVFPMLKTFQLKATLFVITGEIGKKGRCTWTELQEMQDSGLVAIESHSVTHPSMGALPRADAIQELAKSKRILESKLHTTVSVFCYPSGNYSKDTPGLAKTYYRFAVDKQGGVYHMFTQNAYLIPRIRMNRDSSHRFFVKMCNLSSVVPVD